MLPEILEKKFIEMVIEEGIDITTKFTPQKNVIAEIIAKEDGIAAGVYELKVLFETFKIRVLSSVKDGERFKNRDKLFVIEGDSHKILNVERTALDIFSRMCGIATLTNKFCEIAKKIDPNIRIAATRKTTPLFRYFEKRAVEIGGGDTHRMDLEDNVLIKNNHLVLFHNNVEEALKAAIKSASFTNKIEIEVRSKEDALKAAKYAEIIMFDNMNPNEIIEGIKEVKKINKNILFEVSGRVNLNNIEEYAKTGADVLSIGALTHSAKQIDMSLRIVEIREQMDKEKLKYVYYDQKLPVGHKFKEIKFKFNEHKFRFLTDVGMFARFEIDTGTKFLLRNLDIKPDDTFLDLGCGYGVVGITASKFCKSVVMSDVNERAIEMAKRNLKLNAVKNASVVHSDLFENIQNKFTIIATNPPLRAGIEFMRKLIKGSTEHLHDYGRIYIVARKKQNAYEIFKILCENFDASIVEKGGGYVVMRGIKR